MKQLITLIFVIFSLALKSQSLPYFVTCGVYDKKTILKEINREIKKAKKNNLETASLYESKNGDTLFYSNKNDIEGFKVKYVFNLPPMEGDDVKYCGIQEFTFDCSPCSNKHLKDVIHSCGFRKLSNNKYLSSYSWKTDLEVIEQPENKECLILILHYVDKSKKEFKALYNTLVKP